MKVVGKSIVVTGGGNGMGRELVLKLLSKGAKVFALDINETMLGETKKLAGSTYMNQLFTYKLDITDKPAVEQIVESIIAEHGYVDGIINNAGIIQPFIKVNDLSYEAIQKVFNVNFFGTLYITKSFLPHLLKRPEAHILNISSMGGFLPVPGQTIYGASKAAVKLFTEGLNGELKGTSVKVTIAFPGAVKTSIMGNSGLEMKQQSDEGAKSGLLLEPSKAAEIMINAIEKDAYRVLVGKDATILDWFYRLNPKRAASFIGDKMKALIN